MATESPTWSSRMVVSSMGVVSFTRAIGSQEDRSHHRDTENPEECLCGLCTTNHAFLRATRRFLPKLPDSKSHRFHLVAAMPRCVSVVKSVLGRQRHHI